MSPKVCWLVGVNLAWILSYLIVMPPFRFIPMATMGTSLGSGTCYSFQGDPAKLKDRVTYELQHSGFWRYQSYGVYDSFWYKGKTCVYIYQGKCGSDQVIERPGWMSVLVTH